MVEPYPTDHLREKLVSRNITWAEIVETVEHPEVSFGPDERGRMVHQKDSLSVVVARDGAVITALLRTDEQWTDEDARSRVEHPLKRKLSQCSVTHSHKSHEYVKDRTLFTCRGV